MGGCGDPFGLEACFDGPLVESTWFLATLWGSEEGGEI